MKNIFTVFTAFLLIITGCSVPVTNVAPSIKVTNIAVESSKKTFSTKSTANTVTSNIQSHVYDSSYYSSSGVRSTSSGITQLIVQDLTVKIEE